MYFHDVCQFKYKLIEFDFILSLIRLVEKLE